eukprot:4765736-Prymnesium_polylepis.1
MRIDLAPCDRRPAGVSGRRSAAVLPHAQAAPAHLFPWRPTQARAFGVETPISKNCTQKELPSLGAWLTPCSDQIFGCFGFTGFILVVLQ